MKTTRSVFGMNSAMKQSQIMIQSRIIIALMGMIGAVLLGQGNTPLIPSANAADQQQTGQGWSTTWKNLFDGTTLRGWKETDFAGRGEVTVENGQIIIGVGNDMTGITWTNDLPRINYEVSLEAKRVDGSDFFCGLTFPVKEDPCTLVLGGWGGGVVGLSSINGSDASENETTTFTSFQNDRWYSIRLRVTTEKIEVWIDDRKTIDLKLEDRRFSIRIEVEESKPFGIATWRTTGAVRNLRIRALDPQTIRSR